MRRSHPVPSLATAAMAVLAMTACEPQTEDASELEPDTVETMAEPAPAQQTQEVYEARLEGVGGSQASGTATVSLQGGEVQVSVAATGLQPSTRVPQHIHMNASCDNAGGILLNLDDALSAPGQGAPQGDAYPQTDDQGQLQYAASRSLDELRQALAPGQDTAMTDTGMTGMDVQGQQSLDAFELGNRVVNLHGPDMQPVACGPLERAGQIGQAQGAPGTMDPMQDM